MNKLLKSIYTLAIPIMVALIVTGCSEDDKLSGDFADPSRKDVSSRIAGVSAPGLDNPAPNVPMNITGTDLKDAMVVYFSSTNTAGTVFNVGSSAITKEEDGSITVGVPSNAPLGENTVTVIFPGGQAAVTTITLVKAPTPTIYSFSPTAAGAGDVVTVTGFDLDFINSVKVGTPGVTATITEKTATTLKFTVPAGVAAAGPVALTSVAGTVNSTWNFVDCGAAPNNLLCKTNLLLNSGFELGTGDNFTNWGKFNGGTLMTAATAANEVFEGTRSLKVNVNGTQGGNDAWRIQLASDLTPTTIGTSYTATAWIKAAATGGSIRFSTQANPLYGPNTPIPATWTLISWAFTANEANTRVVLDMGGAFNTVYLVDNVRLVPTN